MNALKRICAAMMALLLLGSFCACHKKDEIAVTVEDETFTSATYMYYLINANQEAMSKVQEDLTEEEQASEDVDVYKKKIDGKSFETWVKDTALENLKKSAAYILLCKKNKIELDEEKVSQTDVYAEYYWSSYGYSTLFEPNGVYEETYKKCLKNTLYADAYFDSIYGEEGSKAIAADTLKKQLSENFVLADKLDVTFSEETDEEKAEIKKKLEGYVKALKAGSKTFEQVYHEYNGEEGHTDEAESSDSEELKPKDEHAELIVSADWESDYKSSFSTDYYDIVKKMAKNEVKLQEKEDDAGYVLLVKKDVLGDEYYLKNYDSILRHIVADEEFNKEIDEYVKTLKVDVNSYAVNRFKVKELKSAGE